MCQNWSGSVWVSASLVAQMVKHLPAMQKTQVRSLGWEGLLEKEMATHSTVPGILQARTLEWVAIPFSNA